MFRSSRKVKPEDNELSSDSEGISSLAYTFRGARNSRISRIFHKQEIQFIEKRFQDTALLIFKVSDHEFMDNSKQEVDGMNALLLRNSYKAVFRSDIVAIGGRTLQSGTVQRNKHALTRPVQTIDEVWEPKINTRVNGHKPNFANNAVSPEASGSGNATRKGVCTVT